VHTIIKVRCSPLCWCETAIVRLCVPLAVEVEDVRTALGEMSEGEIPSTTIQQKIRDAERLSNSIGLATTPVLQLEKTETFIRDYAAWRSFILSRTYEHLEIGAVELHQKEMIKLRAAELKKQAQQSLDEAYGGVGIAIVTAMWDDRPEDPYYYCKDEDDTIVIRS